MRASNSPIGSPICVDSGDADRSSSDECDLDKNSRCAPHFIEKEKHVLSQTDLDIVMVKHKIPPNMQLFSIGLGKCPTRPPKGMIALSTKFLESGLTLPFLDTLHKLIHHISLASGQLNPNVWRALATSIIL